MSEPKLREFDLPRDYALLILAGVMPNAALLSRLASRASTIICADGAAEIAREYDVNLHAIIGDLDGITSSTLDHYRTNGTRILEEKEQESNDFEKSLRYLIAQKVRHVRVIGIEGYRADHTLTNFSVMQRYAEKFSSLRAYDLSSELFFLTDVVKRHALIAPINTRVSLLSVAGATGVTTTGLRFPLTNDIMKFGRREGLSNIIVEPHASIRIASGSLLVSVSLLSTLEEGGIA